MTVTCTNSGEAKVRYNELCAELKSISAEMMELAKMPKDSNFDDEHFAALESDGKAIQAELSELRNRFPGIGRLTQPNAVGMRSHRSSGGGVSGNASHYTKLHSLEGQQLSDGGFKSLGEFFAVVGSGLNDNRVSALRVAASSTMSVHGAVMVPERFLAETLHPPGENELIFPNAKVYPMDAGTLNVATLDNLSNADGEMYGGFTAQWVEEGGEFTETTPKTTSIKLNRKKLGLFTLASSELVSDSQYESQLVPALQTAIQDFRDYAFFRGDGNGKPKGILNDVALITVAKETGQAADTLVIENLDAMYARLHPRLVRNAKWYVNPTCIPQLFRLVRTIGTGGVSVPVLNEQSGSFSMYGLPVMLTSKLPVLGDAGDILLADVSQYGIGASRNIAIARSEHYKFQNDQVAWRAIWRGDGQGLWRAPFTPRSGNTLSWCVKLAERA